MGNETILPRRISLISATFFVIANMIGAGVFTTSGLAIADLRYPELVLLAWFIGGVLAVCGALSYGALACHIPESGGEYTFLCKLGYPMAGFLAGWISLLVGFTMPIAAAAFGLQAYVGYWIGAEHDPRWIGSVAIVIAGLMHGIKMNIGVVSQNIAVGIKLLLISGFIAFGFLLTPENIDNSVIHYAKLNLGAFPTTLIWITFAYSGWNAAIYIGGEIKDPRHNLHRSLLLATISVTMIYLALNTLFLYSTPYEKIAGKIEIAAIVAETLGGINARHFVSALVGLALFTSILSMIMASSRVYTKMAHNNALPRCFSSQSDRFGVGVVFQVGLALSVLWMSTFTQLLSYIGFTLGLSSVATISGLMLLRYRKGAERVPIPGYPWVPGLFIVATLVISCFVLVQQGTIAAISLLTIVCGILIYKLLSHRLKQRART